MNKPMKMKTFPSNACLRGHGWASTKLAWDFQHGAKIEEPSMRLGPSPWEDGTPALDMLPTCWREGQYPNSLPLVSKCRNLHNEAINWKEILSHPSCEQFYREECIFPKRLLTWNHKRKNGSIEGMMININSEFSHLCLSEPTSRPLFHL